jgi:uncharacterized membrane protein
MKELVRCKSCGFIMEKDKLHGKCPACGVPEKMFEPYAEKISPSRKLILSLDIHPVLVHFPQAFTVAIVLAAAGALLFGGDLREKLLATMLVLGAVLPFTVALAFCAGLLDGKTRFRRVTTPLLVKKIAAGSAFFLISCAVTACLAVMPLGAVSTLAAVIVLGLIAIGCTSYLSRIGVGLLNAKFPG